MQDDPHKNKQDSDGLDGDSLGKAIGNISDGLSGVFNRALQPSAATDLSLFFRAVKTNRLDLARKFLETGIDPNATNPKGDRALHIAACNNLVDMAQLLVEFGADPKLAQDKEDGRTPLDEAVSFGKAGIAEFLAKAGGYVVGNGASGWTPLHHAAKKGKTEIVEALLRAGADGNEKTDNGSTALIIAIKMRMHELAVRLLDHDHIVTGMNSHFNETDALQRNAFQLALAGKNPPLIKRMLECGAYVNTSDAEGTTPLTVAIASGDPSFVRLVLAYGADVDKSATPSIYFASTCDQIESDVKRAEIVRELMNRGADPLRADPASGRTALLSALDGAQKETFSMLLACGIDPKQCDKDGCPPFFLALAADKKNGKTLFTTAMLEAGVDINQRHMKDGATALIEAVRLGSTWMVTTLLELGANPALCDVQGKSALFYAREGKHQNLIAAIEKSLSNRKAPYIKNAAQDFDL